jgi:hypothetical protein
MLRKEETISFPCRKAFSALLCKAPTSKDRKRAGGATTFRLQNDIFMTSVTFYENEDYLKEGGEGHGLKVNVLVE